MMKCKDYTLLTGANSKFLVEALETLAQSRRTLKFTYVYAFFLPPEETPQKQFFELQQAIAQDIVERLATELMKTEQVDRNKIVYLNKACKQFLAKLLDFFESCDALQLLSTTSQSKKNTKKKSKKDSAFWPCPKCTYANRMDIMTCPICGFGRLGAEGHL